MYGSRFSESVAIGDITPKGSIQLVCPHPVPRTGSSVVARPTEPPTGARVQRAVTHHDLGGAGSDRGRRVQDRARRGSTSVRHASAVPERGDPERAHEVVVFGGIDGERHHAVDVVGGEAGVVERGERRLGGELQLAATRALGELGLADTDDRGRAAQRRHAATPSNDTPDVMSSSIAAAAEPDRLEDLTRVLAQSRGRARYPSRRVGEPDHRPDRTVGKHVARHLGGHTLVVEEIAPFRGRALREHFFEDPGERTVVGCALACRCEPEVADELGDDRARARARSSARR